MQTATNPQTGEKVQWNGSAWVPMGNAAPSAPAGPITLGTPRVDPYKVRDQELQEEAAARAREDQEFQREKFRVEMSQKDKEAKQSDGAKAAGAFYQRALNAHQKYGEGVEPRGAVTQMVVDQLPRPLVNEYSSPERRAAQNFADEFIRAKLRKESGAVIAEEEMAREYEVYFPMPGDGPEDMARKAALREQALEALRSQSGIAAPAADPLAPAPTGGEPQPEETPEGSLYIGEIVGGSQRTSEQEAALQQKMAQHGGAGSAGVMGAVDTATFGLGDEITAGGNAFIQALQGEGSIGDLYNQNIEVERAYREALQGEHGGSYLTGQLIGGAAIPIGAGATGVRGLGAVGAGQGAAYGFGSSEGNPLERLPGAATGAVVGGAVGAGLGAAAPYATNALSRFGNRPSVTARQAEAAEARPIIEAGERRNIPIRQPDARPSVRNEFAAAEATEGGGPIIKRQLSEDAAAVQADARGLGTGGRARDQGGMGELAQGVVNRHGIQSKAAAKGQYAIVERMAPDFVADASPVVGSINRVIGELEASGANATKSEREFLKGIADDISSSGLSVRSLQTQRESARKRMQSAGIDHHAAEARLDQVMGEMGDALDTALASNPPAQAALRRANKIWAERSEFRREVARTFLGKNGDVTIETAGQRLEKMFERGGDSKRFGRIWGEMTEAERADIRATIIEGAGSRGRKEFSLAELAKSIDGMNPRTMVRTFGTDGARALKDIKTIANAKADTLAGLNNSKSGVVGTHNNGLTLRTLLFGGLGATVGDVTGAIGGAALSRVSSKLTGRRAARLLLNPDFTKWLRQTPPTTNPQAINRHFSRLSSIAAKDAVFVADVKALQSVLADAFSEGTTRAAAGQQKDD